MKQRSKKDLPNHTLREERLRHRWSQREVAHRIGTTTNNVSRWELGITTPGPYFRDKLSALFGKPPQELGLPGGPADEQQHVELSTSPTSGTLHTDLPDREQSTFVWCVPYPRNPHFTGRDELLNQLDQRLSPHGQEEQTTARRVALAQPQAIKGLGGIGKTQIALEYTYRAREQGRFIHILWLNAASEEAIMNSLIALADLLPNFSARNEMDQRKLVAAVKRWLEQCEQPWLLICDNADELSLLQDFLPVQGIGSILLTTRASAVGALAASLEVDTMSLMEGTQLLLRRAQCFSQASDEEINEAGNIVIALDHFPLALDQAGAYIEETRCSFSTYLQIYQQRRRELLARRGGQATNYPESVATTWSLSFQRIEQANPAAAELLRLCAFLAPDHIPEELLYDGAPHWPPVLQQAAVDPFTFNQMLEEVLKFSLVKRLAENSLLSIHRLVQVVLKERMEPEEQRQWAERVVCAVNDVFPRDPKGEVATWPQCLRYLEQVQACNSLIQHYQLMLPQAADLLERTGTYLRERGLYTLAEPLYQRALRIQEQLLEPNHLQAAACLCNLADLYRIQGIYEQAEPLYQRARRIQEQSLGPQHPDLAHTLNNLAALYRRRGMYEQAEPLFQQALSIWEHTLGPDHSLVASALANLANLYREQGKYEQAEPLFLRSLRIFEQLLDPSHPRMATLLNNLAIFYSIQGMYEQAEPLFQRALRIREQSLGPDHPDVATSLNNLANLYRERDTYEQAEPLFQRSLRIREQSLGSDHPAVASALHNLANLYREQGIYEQAEPLFQRSLRIREKTLVAQHPEMAEVLHDFAVLREAQGQAQEAKSLYQRALTIREQVYGPHHSSTVETRTRYCALLRAMGREEEASRAETAQTE